MKICNKPSSLAAIILSFIIIMPVVSSTYEETNSIALDHLTGTANFQVLTLKYDPYPVGPGEYVEVWLKLGNEGDQDIKDLTFELLPEFPFSLDPSEETARHFGTVLANSMVLVRYKVRVSPDAVTGETPLKYRYRYANSDYAWEEGIEMIKIQTREAMLDISSIQTLPSMIEPGKEADVTITLKNLGSSVMRDVSVILDLTMSTVARSAAVSSPEQYYDVIPLVPVGSSGEKRVDYLKPGEKVDVTYRLLAFADAKAKTYKVPILIMYQDELGKNYTKANIIGLTIGSEPDLSISISDNKIYGKGTTGDVSVKIVNKGATDVKFMNVVLKQSDSYDIVSADTIYIGNVDSDDYENADFKLYVKSLASGNKLKLPVLIEYRDSNGNEYKKDLVLETKIYSMSQRGMAGSSKVWIVVLIIILMVGAWFGYTRWEKKKKKKQ